MRIPAVIDQADSHPPPPYTPRTLLSPLEPFSTETTFPDQLSLRGGYVRPTLSPGADSGFVSAAAYFDERPCTGTTQHDILEHHITVPTGAMRMSLYFPHPERKYQDRDVRISDWYTFVNYLIPDPAESFANEAKDHGEVLDELERVEAVVAEWNEGFFGPRGVRIINDPQPLEAPAYRSLIDLSPDDVPVQAPLVSKPAGAESSTQIATSDRHKARKHHHHHRHPPPLPPSGPNSHHRRSSVSSIVSTSSSSSSSSLSSCSIGSLSSGDLVGSDFSQVIGSLLSLRHDPARKSNIKASIKQMAQDLRAQRRAVPQHERKQWSRGFKSELHAQKKTIKTEIKLLIKEAKAARKLDRQSRKAERKAERHSRRAERKEWRRCARNPHCHPHPHHTHPWRAGEAETAAARAFEIQSRAWEIEFQAQEKAREAQAWAYEREMRDRDLEIERDRDLATARQLPARMGEMTLQSRGERGGEMRERIRQRTWIPRGSGMPMPPAAAVPAQESGIVDTEMQMEKGAGEGKEEGGGVDLRK